MRKAKENQSLISFEEEQPIENIESKREIELIRVIHDIQVRGPFLKSVKPDFYNATYKILMEGVFMTFPPQRSGEKVLSLLIPFTNILQIEFKS